jgi:hypothetical protein
VLNSKYRQLKFPPHWLRSSNTFLPERSITTHHIIFTLASLDPSPSFLYHPRWLLLSKKGSTWRLLRLWHVVRPIWRNDIRIGYRSDTGADFIADPLGKLKHMAPNLDDQLVPHHNRGVVVPPARFSLWGCRSSMRLFALWTNLGVPDRTTEQ